MAVLGDLADFSISDVLRIVRTKTGVLYLYSALGGRSLELGLHRNHLLCMFVDGLPVTKPEKAVEILQHLAQEGQGKFSFENQALEALTRHYTLPLDQGVSQGVAQRKVGEAELPHPLTRFRSVEPLPTVPSVLVPYWQRAEPFMRRGSNGEELAAALGISVRDALTLIYRLRAVSLIQVMRAPMVAPTAAANGKGVPAQVTNETRSVLRRMIGRLRGNA